MKKTHVTIALLGVILTGAAALLDGDPSTVVDWAGLAQAVGAVLTVYGVGAQSKWASLLRTALELAAKHGDRVEGPNSYVTLEASKKVSEAEQKAAGVHEVIQEVRGKA